MARLARVWGLATVMLMITGTWADSSSRFPTAQVRADLQTLQRAGLIGATLNTATSASASPADRRVWAAAWRDAYRAIGPALGSNQRVAEPDPQVREVAAALFNLLKALRPELRALGVDSDRAREDLLRLPEVAASLASLKDPAASVAAAGGSSRPTSSLVEDHGAVLGLGAPRPLASLAGLAGGETVGGGLGLASLAVGGRAVPTPGQDSRVLGGRVLAADLRFRLGDSDSAVLLEYARSHFDPGYRLADGQEMRALYQPDLGRHLSVAYGYSRLSGDYGTLSGLTSAGDRTLSGLQAGVGFQAGDVRLAGQAKLYHPETSEGLLGSLGGDVNYRPFANLQLHLAYQTSASRGVTNLQDAWRDQINADVALRLGPNTQAHLNWAYDTGDQITTTAAPDRTEHTLGASLSVGF
jgi:hypothetical protein